MATSERLGINIAADVTELKAGIRSANKTIREAESEFKAAAAGMDDWSKSEEGLKAKINSLNKIVDANKTKVDKLKAEYTLLVNNGMDPASDQASELRTKINKEEAALKENEKALRNQKSALAGMSAQEKEAGTSFQKLTSIAKKGAIAAGAGVTALATQAVAAGKAIFSSAKDVAAYGVEVNKNSQKLGLSKQAYQEWAYVFQRSGSDISKMQVGMKTLSKAITDASNGSDSAAKKFEAIGLSIDDIAGKSQEEQFEAVITALQGMESGAERTAAASALLGKSSVDLAGLFNKTAEETANLRNEAEMYGLVMSDEAIAKSAAFTKQLGLLNSTMAAAKRNIVGELLPGITDLMAGFSGMIAGVEGADEKLKSGMEQFSQALIGMIPKIIQILTTIVTTVAQMAPGIIEALANGILSALPGLIEMLPAIVNAFVQMLTDLSNAILAAIPDILAAMISIIPQLVESLTAAIPQVIAVLFNAVSAVVNSIPAVLDALLAALPQIINGIVQGLLRGIPTIINAAINLLMSIVKAVPTIVGQLVSVLPTIIASILQALLNAVPQVLKAAITLLQSLIKAIPQIISQLILALPKIIVTITKFLTSNVGMVVQAAIQLFTGLLKAIPQIVMELINAMPQIISGIVDGLMDGASQIFDVGVNLLKGLWDGITSWASNLWDNIKNLGNSIVGWFEDVFDINSPSKVMKKRIGVNLALGVGEGLDEGMKDVKKRIDKAVTLDNQPIDINATGTSGVNFGQGRGVIVNQTNNYSQEHSRYEIYKSRQDTAAAVRLALGV